jgi:hypothetical protein
MSTVATFSSKRIVSSGLANENVLTRSDIKSEPLLRLIVIHAAAYSKASPMLNCQPYVVLLLVSAVEGHVIVP